MNGSISGIISPEWDQIASARNDSFKFLSSNGMNTDVVDTITMITGELLENAIKYGSIKSDILYSISIESKTITVEVKNPIEESSDENLRRLDRIIQWIRGYQNPFEAYVEKLKEVAAKPLEDSTSGLGLTRIAYEGQSIVDFYAADNGMISVSAVYQI